VRVGNYKFSIEDVLGKGYSSKVYKGVEVGKEHKKYAIKAVDLKKFRGSNLDMLESEIEIHKALNHENIVKCHEVIKTPHHYYIVLEYCPHGNLMDYINQKKKIGESMAI
jgi:serine/threonine protein kinase